MHSGTDFTRAITALRPARSTAMTSPADQSEKYKRSSCQRGNPAQKPHSPAAQRQPREQISSLQITRPAKSSSSTPQPERGEMGRPCGACRRHTVPIDPTLDLLCVYVDRMDLAKVRPGYGMRVSAGRRRRCASQASDIG